MEAELHLLVVDDDPKFRETVRRGLVDSGIACDAVGGVEAAVRTLELGAEFDAILLDVMMPERSGWEFLEQIRKQGDETPVIFVTARHAVEERVRGLMLGADDYIIKPFEFTELLARIHVVTRRHRTARKVRVGKLEIDIAQQLIHRGGIRIEISPREFQVLRALVHARGSVCTRAELLHSVWGMDFDPGTNVVDVAVARLRRKIETPDLKVIETVVGEGYRLAATGGESE